MENIDFEDYTLPDLFTLLSFLHCEEFPTATLSKKKARGVEVIGEQLGVENKEVIWMVESRKKKRLRQKMADEERENAATKLNDRNWQLLTREVQTLVDQNSFLINEIGEIKKQLQKLDEMVPKLEEEEEKKM